MPIFPETRPVLLLSHLSIIQIPSPVACLDIMITFGVRVVLEVRFAICVPIFCGSWFVSFRKHPTNQGV